jgi:hypothetical protein
MPVEDTAAVMADIAVPVAGMPPRPMFEVDTMVLLFAAGVVIALLETRAATRAMQGAHIMPLAAVTGEVTGHIRTTDIRGPAWANYGLGYGYPYYGYYGYRSGGWYAPYYPYYPYRYGYWPHLSFSFWGY